MGTLKEMYDERAKLASDNKKLLDGAKQNEQGQAEMNAEETEKFDGHYDQIMALSTRIEQGEKVASTQALLDAPRPRKAGTHSSEGEEGLNTGKDADKGPIQLQVGGKMISIKPGGKVYEALEARGTAEYEDAYNTYLDTGQFSAVLKTSDDAAGGSLTTTEMLRELIKFVDDEVFMRKLGRVLPPLRTAVSLGVPSWDTDPSDADWTPEVPAVDIAEDTGPKTGGRELVPHLNTKRVDLSLKLLRSAVIPMAELITERIGYKHAISEENAFLTGNGNHRPLGVFTAHADGVTTAQDVDSVGTLAIHADDFSEVLMSLKPQYQSRSTWLLHRDSLKQAMQLKDGNAQYIWQPGLQGGIPNMILGRPYVQNENAPNTFTDGSYVIVIGDFKNYWIVDSLQFSVQRLDEIAALQNKVVFLGRKETDGMPVLAEAFRRLKIKA